MKPTLQKLLNYSNEQMIELISLDSIEFYAQIVKRLKELQKIHQEIPDRPYKFSSRFNKKAHYLAKAIKHFEDNAIDFKRLIYEKNNHTH